MKKISIILLILILFVTLTGCSSKKLTDAMKFKNEYESLNNTTRESDGKKIRKVSIPEDNPIIYKKAPEIVDMINNKETFIVYFGFADCPWCRSIIETLLEVAKDKNIDKIYYVDVKNIRDTKTINENGEIEVTNKGGKGYSDLLEKLDNVLENYTLKKDDEEIVAGKRIYAPNVVVINKGEAKKLESGVSDKQEDAYQKLTKELKQDTYNKFECLVKCILEEKTTCEKNKC